MEFMSFLPSEKRESLSAPLLLRYSFTEKILIIRLRSELPDVDLERFILLKKLEQSYKAFKI